MSKPLNCHYVTQFTLRNFGKRISVYDVQEGKLYSDKNPEDVFSEGNLYEYTMERKFNERMECEYASLFRDYMLGEEIDLKRVQLYKLKRYLLMCILRTPYSKSEVNKTRKHFKDLAEQHPDKAKFLMQRYYVETQPEGMRESDEDYWKRTLDCVLNYVPRDHENIADTIYDDAESTYDAWNWALIVDGCYVSFWDAPESDEFLITDAGMTYENEPEWVLTEINKNKNTLISAFLNNDRVPADMRRELSSIQWLLCHWDANFMMFPISSHRMIVLMNKFFKFYWALRNIKSDIRITGVFTELESEDLFKPNSGGIIPHEQEMKLSDTFHYVPIKMTPRDCWYCNILFMDRVDRWLGFAHEDKARCTFAMSMPENTGIPLRNDYSKLYEALKLR